MSSLKPLGIFMVINEFFNRQTLFSDEDITNLRIFISNKFNNNCIEYQFCCFCDYIRNTNDSIIQSLKGNGCDVLPIDSNSEINVFLQLDQMVKQFVESYGFDTIVVLISNNSYLNSTIRLIKHREVSVLLISDKKPNETITEWIAFNNVFNRTVILWIKNIPKNKSRKTIRDSFIPISRQFNCKFRFNRKEAVKLEFNNANDSQRALLRLNELNFFGHHLNIEMKTIDHNLMYSSSADSSNSSLVSIPITGKESVLPQNDDKCKSVIIGLFTRFNQNVDKLVRNLIKEWNDPIVNDSIIYRVNRERDFIGRDGRASLIVTAINKESNYKLIDMAKKYFVDREKKLYWNRLQRSAKKNNKQTNSPENVAANRKMSGDSEPLEKASIPNQSLRPNLMLKSNSKCLSQRSNTIMSYASIASKPIINSTEDLNEFYSKEMIPRRRDVNRSCKCH